jgi:hypothetical protein
VFQRSSFVLISLGRCSISSSSRSLHLHLHTTHTCSTVVLQFNFDCSATAFEPSRLLKFHTVRNLPSQKYLNTMIPISANKRDIAEEQQSTSGQITSTSSKSLSVGEDIRSTYSSDRVLEEYENSKHPQHLVSCKDKVPR